MIILATYHKEGSVLCGHSAIFFINRLSLQKYESMKWVYVLTTMQMSFYICIYRFAF